MLAPFTMAEDTAYNQAEKADDGSSRTGLAKDRTHMAEDRTIMAVERTFAGWLRTAFGAIAIAVGFRALFGDLDPPWLARAIATVFMIIAVLLSILAQHRAVRSLDKMATHAVERPSKWYYRWLGYTVAAGAALLAAGIWTLD